MLARPEYADARPGLVQQVLDVVTEFLGRVLERVIGAGSQTLVGTVAVLLLVVALTVLVLRFLRGVRRDPTRDAPTSGDVGRSPDSWEAEAADHERAGRRRDALRCRYRLLLARLASQGLIEEVPGRTTGEYLRTAAAALPAATAELTEVTAAFEQAWYGDLDVTGDDVAGVRDAVDRVAGVARGRGGHGEPVSAGRVRR